MINYCPECGNKTVDGANFCMKCGFSIAEAQKEFERLTAERKSIKKIEVKNELPIQTSEEKIQKPLELPVQTSEEKSEKPIEQSIPKIEEPIVKEEPLIKIPHRCNADKNIFYLLNQSFSFNDDFVVFNTVYSSFVRKAYLNKKSFAKNYDANVKNFDDFYKFGVTNVYKTLQGMIEFATEFIKIIRGIKIDSDKFYKICRDEGTVKDVEYLKPVLDIFEEVKYKIEQLAEYRKNERDWEDITKSKWDVGYGATGWLISGMLNTATDAVRGVGHAITDVGDSNKIENMKNDIFRNRQVAGYKNMSEYLKAIIEPMCLDVFWGVVPIIDLYIPVRKEAVEYSRELVHRAETYRPVDKMEATNALIEYPYEIQLYFMILAMDKDSYVDLVDIAEFSGMNEKFLDVVSINFNKELKQFLPDSNDDLESLAIKKNKIRNFCPEMREKIFEDIRNNALKKIDEKKEIIERELKIKRENDSEKEKIKNLRDKNWAYKQKIDEIISKITSNNFDEAAIESLWKEAVKGESLYTFYAMDEKFGQYARENSLNSFAINVKNMAQRGNKAAECIEAYNGRFRNNASNVKAKESEVIEMAEKYDFAKSLAATLIFSKNPQKALKYFKEAAWKFDPLAMAWLGSLYRSGDQALLPRNSELSRAWLSLALECNSSFKWAREELNKLNSGDFSVKEESDSSCFITTAVCKNFGKPDDCYELTMFRKFRDEWLINQADGASLINEYYKTAPKIVENIDKFSNAKEIYQNIWNSYLKKCLKHIENRHFASCKEIYIEMVNKLKSIYAR